MIALLGKNFMLYVAHLDKMRPLMCATTMSLSFNAEIKEATKKPGSRFKQCYASNIGFTLNSDAVYSMIEAGEEGVSGGEMATKLCGSEQVKWIAQDVTDSDIIYSGTALASSLSLVSNAEGPHTFSFSINGDGKIMVTTPYQVYVYGSPDNKIYDNNYKLYGRVENNGFPELN